MRSTSSRTTTPSCISLDQKVKINLIVAYVSIQNNTFIVSGDAETKTIKDLLPDIIQQLGPKQHKLLQELVTSSMTTGASEEVPNLVDANEDLNKVEWSVYFDLFQRILINPVRFFRDGLFLRWANHNSMLIEAYLHLLHKFLNQTQLDFINLNL